MKVDLLAYIIEEKDKARRQAALVKNGSKSVNIFKLQKPTNSKVEVVSDDKDEEKYKSIFFQ